MAIPGRCLAMLGLAPVWLALAGPAQAASFSTIYLFPKAALGAQPSAPLTKLGGKLFGTTAAGGKYKSGTVFALSGAGRHITLHEFQGGSDGAYPFSQLVDVNGTFYGVTQYGGAATQCYQGCGTIFAITPQGDYRQIYQFSGGADGAFPNSPLVLNGTLYGTADEGGPCQCGTVFASTPTGQVSTVYTFQGGGDGVYPIGLMTDGSSFYGVTSMGGGGSCEYGCGTVFSVTPQGSEKVLYAFPKPKYGEMPLGTLLKHGNFLYGTTFYGGAGLLGTVFRVSLSGGYRVVHSFASYEEGAYPDAGLTQINGVLYGTTFEGGANGAGTIFSITPKGALTTVYTFTDGTDGALPDADLLNVQGTLYGVARGGGSYLHGCRGGCGTLFSFTP